MNPSSILDLPGSFAQTQNQPMPAFNRQRVLVVDDEPRIRAAIRACLEIEGYEIDEARNGRIALKRIVEQPPDLVILDLAMPELDGLSVMRMLNEVFDPPTPAIVVLTAYGSISAATAAEEYGAKAFLEKPLVPDTLREVVSRALRDRKSRPRDRSEPLDPPLGPPWFG